jgi:uncharacterized membrane protein YccC
MYSRNRFPKLRLALTIVFIVMAILFDTIFGLSQFPILTIIVCGIVALYECVSPFIYSPR